MKAYLDGREGKQCIVCITILHCIYLHSGCLPHLVLENLEMAQVNALWFEIQSEWNFFFSQKITSLLCMALQITLVPNPTKGQTGIAVTYKQIKIHKKIKKNFGHCMQPNTIEQSKSKWWIMGHMNQKVKGKQQSICATRKTRQWWGYFFLSNKLRLHRCKVQ